MAAGQQLVTGRLWRLGFDLRVSGGDGDYGFSDGERR